MPSTMVARDPCRLGQCELGYTRLSVYTSAYERAMTQVDRLIYRRVAQRFVDQDTTTGWHDPTYTEQATYGWLGERGSRMPAFVGGVVTQMDARMITLYGYTEADQVRDPLNNRIYEVQGEPVEVYDPDTEGFAYRNVALHYRPFMRS